MANEQVSGFHILTIAIDHAGPPSLENIWLESHSKPTAPFTHNTTDHRLPSRHSESGHDQLLKLNLSARSAILYLKNLVCRGENLEWIGGWMRCEAASTWSPPLEISGSGQEAEIQLCNAIKIWRYEVIFLLLLGVALLFLWLLLHYLLLP